MSLSDKVKELNEKIPQVYETGIEAGKYQEWSEFWDSIQTKGSSPDNYDYKFMGVAWNDDTFRPKYNIVPSSGAGVRTFHQSRIKDLETCLKKGGIDGKGVILDLSKCTNANEMFLNATVEIIPEIDVSKASLYYFCGSCTKLVTVRKMNVGDSRMLSSNVFSNCKALANIVIEGTFTGTSSFQHSPLTAESAISVITHLKNYKGTENEYAYTLTLSASTKTLLEAEGESSPDNTTWSDYISSLGWNLV